MVSTVLLSLDEIADRILSGVETLIAELPKHRDIPSLRYDEVRSFRYLDEFRAYSRVRVATREVAEYLGAYVSSVDSRDSRSRFRFGLFSRYKSIAKNFERLSIALNQVAASKTLPEKWSEEDLISEFSSFSINMIGIVDFILVEFARAKNAEVRKSGQGETIDENDSKIDLNNEVFKRFIDDFKFNEITKSEGVWFGGLKRNFRNSFAHRELISPVLSLVEDQEAFDIEASRAGVEISKIGRSGYIYESDRPKEVIAEFSGKVNVHRAYFPCCPHVKLSKYLPTLSLISDYYLRGVGLVLNLLVLLRSKIDFHRSHVNWADGSFIGYIPERVDFENQTASFDVRHKFGISGLGPVNVRTVINPE